MMRANMNNLFAYIPTWLNNIFINSNSSVRFRNEFLKTLI